MRILDRLVAGEEYVRFRGPVPPDEAIRIAQPVDIDNVADYVFRNVKVGDSWSLRTDFPNIAPPFELAWFEYRRPPWIASLTRDVDAVDDTTPGLPDHVGVFAAAREVDDGWITTYALWSQSGKEKMRGPVSFEFSCDREGAVLADSRAVRIVSDPAFRADQASAIWAIADLLVPVLMATSLLHAKNVTIEREPPIDARLQRARQKRGKAPLVRFHRLRIDPMRAVLRAAGAESGTGIRQAMHIVRGHFKDYRDGRGLFGRYRGLYWWDQHLAGEIEEGFVEKEYVVNRPR